MTTSRYAVAAALFVVLFAVPNVASARQSVFTAENGHVEFTSSVPLNEFTGASDKLVGRIDLDSSIVDFFVDLATLDTGNGKRDKDMLATLEVGKYPFAEFYGTLATPFDVSSAERQPVRVRGRFTIHGVGRDIEVEGYMQRTEKGIRVTASFQVRLGDHDIRPPRLLVMKVRDVQEVRLDVMLAPSTS